MTEPRPALATIVDLAGIVLGTFLAAVGAVSLVVAIAERDIRGLIGLAPAIAGAMILIAATRYQRRTGAGRRPLLGRVMRIVVAIAVTGAAMLVVQFVAFTVLVSDLLLVMSPEWQAAAPHIEPSWFELAGASAVGGTMLTFAVLSVVLAWNMRLLPLVAVIAGALLTVNSAAFVATAGAWPPALVLLAVGVALMLAPWLRRPRAFAVRAVGLGPPGPFESSTDPPGGGT
jgi:hypothetical protein